MEDKYLTYAEAIKFLKLSRATIDRLIAKKAIPNYKVGKRRLFDRDELIDWVKSHRSDKPKRLGTMENIGTFVKRLSLSVGCYSHPNQSPSQYSLKKYDTTQRGRMGVFGWVREHKRKGIFEVSSYKDLGDKAGVNHLADCVKPNYQFTKDGILFYVKPDSEGRDYRKTVKALKAIIALKS